MNPEAIEPLTHINVNVLHAGDTHISTRLDDDGPYVVITWNPYTDEVSTPSTTVEDKNGLIHDLSKLVNTQCLIDTGESTFMAVQDFHNIDTDPYWMSWDGGKYTPEELAEYINLMLMGGNGIEITVHELHS